MSQKSKSPCEECKRKPNCPLFASQSETGSEARKGGRSGEKTQ